MHSTRLWSLLLAGLLVILQASALPTDNRQADSAGESAALELLVRQVSNATVPSRPSLLGALAASSSTASTARPSTSTGSAAPTSGMGLPTPPSGSRLTQHSVNGKPGTTATVPIFANKNYVGTGSNSAKSAWIGLHGRLRDGNQLFAALYNVVGDTGVAVVPNFYTANDIQTVQTAKQQGKPSPIWLQPDRNIVWDDNWRYGSDAVAGGTSRPLNGEAISSLDIIDSLIKNLSNKSRYPNMARITVVGHSAGAGLTDIYSHFGPKAPAGIKIRYIQANTPTSYMLDTRRPVSAVDLAQCPGFNNWPYGSEGFKPRYISNAMSSWSFARTCSRDVVRLSGSKDTFKVDAGGDQSCMAWAQGGGDRTNRGQAAWIIDNLRANTQRGDLPRYASYENITTFQGGVPTQQVPTFAKTFALVYGVGHDAGQMFASDYGRQALLKTTPIAYTQSQPAPH